MFFLMIIDLKRSIDRGWLFKSGATFIRQGPLLTWSKWVGEPDYTFILRWPRYLGADMWGAEKVICYLPVYSEPVSCRPVELPSICLSWRTTILRYIVKDNVEYIAAKDIPTILHTCFDKTPHMPRCTAADTPWNRWSEKHSCLVESYWNIAKGTTDPRVEFILLK